MSEADALMGWCASCVLCAGTGRTPGARDVFIVAHGYMAKAARRMLSA